MGPVEVGKKDGAAAAPAWCCLSGFLDFFPIPALVQHKVVSPPATSSSSIFFKLGSVKELGTKLPRKYLILLE